MQGEILPCLTEILSIDNVIVSTSLVDTASLKTNFNRYTHKPSTSFTTTLKSPILATLLFTAT
jgi:hypothetical protein